MNRILALFFVIRTHRQSNGLEIEVVHLSWLALFVIDMALFTTMFYLGFSYAESR